jgi:hypothetical protein
MAPFQTSSLIKQTAHRYILRKLMRPPLEIKHLLSLCFQKREQTQYGKEIHGADYNKRHSHETLEKEKVKVIG